MEYTIKDSEVGKEFLTELIKIIEIRKEKRLMYKDSFLTDDINTLFTIIKGKIKRYEISGKLDDLQDCCNYLIFVLCLEDIKKHKINIPQIKLQRDFDN